MPDKSENFISLKCRSCGGKLDVYSDMDRFACGYCGTEMIVQRRGGTVALREVEACIKQVQIGTDKTAAELAIARYEAEARELRQAESDLAKQLNSERWKTYGCGGVLLLIGLSVISTATGFGEFALVVGGIFLIGGISSIKSKGGKWTELRTRRSELERRIADKTRIADG
jgi:predicted RNA-binding Zn-ribbon protein involved in translation (DUF1610 family)